MSSFDNFFNEKEAKLVDLSWLDINPEDYKNLPFDPIPPYIAVPKLEEAWKHLEDQNLKLVPNSDMNFNYKTPENPLTNVPELLNYTKKKMMSGKTGKDLVELLQEKATPNLIKAAYDQLKTLSAEQGLLGHVYVDPTPFKKCEEGSEYVSKRAKTAKFVLAMPSCSGCFYNKCGRCDIYRKHVATEINYDQDLLQFYSKHFSSLVGKDVTLSSKEDLQKKFLEKEVIQTKIAEFKPTVKEVEDEKSLEDKQKTFDTQYKDLESELNKTKKESVEKDISLLLVKGYSGKVIRDYIKTKYSREEFMENKEVFDDILSRQGSMGPVYLDMDKSPIETKDQNKLTDFLKEVAPKTKYLVVNPQGPHGKGPQLQKIKDVGRKLHKEVVPSVNDIPKHAFHEAFEQYPIAIRSKLAAVFDQDHIKGLRLAFIQKDLSRNIFGIKENADVFNLKGSLDTTPYIPPKDATVSFTANKISHALDRGYPLSSIIKTGKNLGVADGVIIENIKKALENRQSISKYQVDVKIKLPETVRVASTQKDVSLDMSKRVSEEEIPEFAYHSSSAPVDSLVNEMGLKESEIKVDDAKSNELEISGLNTIGF